MSQIEYDDFGKTDDKTSGYGYDGEKLDTTGNIYLRARYYNPRIGQFIQIDDYKGTQDNLTSQNRYTYCLNNQYKYMDPSGNSITVALLGLTAYELAKYLAIGFVIVGGILAIKQATTKKSTVPSTKGIIKPVKDILKKGKKATKNLKNTITKKIKPKKVIQTVTKAIAPTIPAGIKALKSTLTIPQPCPVPTNKSWNDVSNNLRNMAKTLGMLGVLNYLLGKVDINKKYKYPTNRHHIVFRTGKYGRSPHSLDDSREDVIKVYGNINVEQNIAEIYTGIHVHIHTNIYKEVIVNLFLQKLYKTPEKVKIRLQTMKSFLLSLNTFFYG